MVSESFLQILVWTNTDLDMLLERESIIKTIIFKDGWGEEDDP